MPVAFQVQSSDLTLPWDIKFRLTSSRTDKTQGQGDYFQVRLGISFKLQISSLPEILNSNWRLYIYKA